MRVLRAGSCCQVQSHDPLGQGLRFLGLPLPTLREPPCPRGQPLRRLRLRACPDLHCAGDECGRQGGPTGRSTSSGDRPLLPHPTPQPGQRQRLRTGGNAIRGHDAGGRFAHSPWPGARRPARHRLRCGGSGDSSPLVHVGSTVRADGRSSGGVGGVQEDLLPLRAPGSLTDDICPLRLWRADLTTGRCHDEESGGATESPDLPSASRSRRTLVGGRPLSLSVEPLSVRIFLNAPGFTQRRIQAMTTAKCPTGSRYCGRVRQATTSSNATFGLLCLLPRQLAVHGAGST
jgi:hypothetical protein